MSLGLGNNVTGRDLVDERALMINGTVWEDTNNDNDGDSSSISGITMKLYNKNNEMVAERTTDENGAYSFGGLSPGSYTVKEQVVIPGMITSMDGNHQANKPFSLLDPVFDFLDRTVAGNCGFDQPFLL